MRRVAVAAVLALLLAGCLGGGKDPGPAEGAEVDQGSISGVVVSQAIVPLAGVKLRLEPAGLDATSDQAGAFAFEDLREGSYTLTASLDGYVPATLPVATGGEVAKVVLDPDPQVGAYVEAYVFDGFVDQSFNVGVARSGSATSPNFTIGLRAPDFIQMEMVWQSTQAFGKNLDLTAIANDGNLTVPDFARAQGPSPLLLAINSSLIQEYRLGPDVFLDMAVFAGSDDVAAGKGAGVAVSQSYRLVTHMFYGYLPPDGWRFTVDGDPPPPPA